MRYFFLLLLITTNTVLASDDGSVEMNITGIITAESCNVDTGSTNRNIKIGDFDIGEFPAQGSTTPSVSLPITLDNCTSGVTGADIIFSGTTDATNPELLALNSGSNMAKGIAVQILDSNNNPIALNSPFSLPSLSTGDNPLTFNLRYKSTQASVLPGDASAILYFDIGYQ